MYACQRKRGINVDPLRVWVAGCGFVGGRVRVWVDVGGRGRVFVDVGG